MIAQSTHGWRFPFREDFETSPIFTHGDALWIVEGEKRCISSIVTGKLSFRISMVSLAVFVYCFDVLNKTHQLARFNFFVAFHSLEEENGPKDYAEASFHTS